MLLLSEFPPYYFDTIKNYFCTFSLFLFYIQHILSGSSPLSSCSSIPPNLLTHAHFFNLYFFLLFLNNKLALLFVHTGSWTSPNCSTGAFAHLLIICRRLNLSLKFNDQIHIVYLDFRTNPLRLSSHAPQKSPAAMFTGVFATYALTAFV